MWHKVHALYKRRNTSVVTTEMKQRKEASNTKAVQDDTRLKKGGCNRYGKAVEMTDRV